MAAILVVAIASAAPGLAQAAPETSKPKAARPAVDDAAAVRVGAVQVAIDPATGRLRPPTPAEAQALAVALSEMLNTSTEGLVQVELGDGTVVVDLEERFMNVAVAFVDAEGLLDTECISDAAAAAVLMAPSSSATPTPLQEK